MTGVAHVAVNVDDNNACTIDGCAIDGSPVHVAVNVDDSNACTTDACDPTNGVSHTSVGVDDNNACTTDSCDRVTGVAHVAVNVDDNNACTTDSCDRVTGVAHVAVNVDDNNACTTDACDPTNGVSHTSIGVDDNNACTTDSCDPTRGVEHPPVDVDDLVACTVDTCDAQTGVAHRPDHLACAVGEFCDGSLGCQSGSESGDVVITELRLTGSASTRFVELRNTTASPIDVDGFLLRGANNAVATIRARAGSGPAVLPPGASAEAVLSVDGPADAALLLVATSGTLAGGPWSLQTSSGAVHDVLPTFAVEAPLDGNLTTTALPFDTAASGARSTQVDVARANAVDNNSLDNWCLSFLSADTRGAPNRACRGAVVVNEVLADFNHVAHGGVDEARQFVELAGPGGALIAGLVVVHEDPAGGFVAGSLQFTMPAGRRMPLDGVLVLADGDVDGGLTEVPNADFVVGAFALSPDAGSVRVVDVTTTLDRIAWGDPPSGGLGTSVAEGGDPVLAIAGPAQSFALARDATSSDTNDNLVDFISDPSPTPGTPNGAVNVDIRDLDPVAGPVAGGTSVSLVVADAAIVASVNLVPAAAAPAITFGGLAATCVVVDVAEDGRGPTRFSCSTPSRSGLVPEAGAVDVVVANPAIVPDSGSTTGGSDNLVGGFLYE